MTNSIKDVRGFAGHPAGGQQSGRGAPGHGHAPATGGRARREADRGGPARDRAGEEGRYPPEAASRHERGVRERHGERADTEGPGGPRVRGKPHRGLRRACRHGGRLHPERVAEICGIDARDLEAAAEMYATAERAPIVYCLGVVEHSTAPRALWRCRTWRWPRASWAVRLRHQPAARPEQRAGRVRHGRGPGRLHGLSEGGEPRDAREVRGRMGRRAEPGCRSEGH